MPGFVIQNLNVAFGLSSLGLVLVAENEGELCALLLGDERDALLGELKQLFPNVNTTLVSSGLLAAFVADLVHRIEDPHFSVTCLPLHMLGTEFQCRVWRQLTKIPSGSVMTYSEVAAAIGQPDATRAVANACAANKIAVLIPCHRVVRMDGALGGYRWGKERKEKLLTRERVARSLPPSGICG